MDTKICTSCGKTLTIDKFNKNNFTIDGYYYKCKECISEYGKKYRKINAESLKIRKAKSYQKNKANIAIKDKIYREIHKIAISKWNRGYRKINRKAFALRMSKYMKANPEKFRAKNQVRAARKLLLTHTLTTSQWNQIKLQFGNRCCYCGEEKPLTFEHFIPLSKGGEYATSNIIPSCQHCNSSKRNSNFSE